MGFRARSRQTFVALQSAKASSELTITMRELLGPERS